MVHEQSEVLLTIRGFMEKQRFNKQSEGGFVDNQCTGFMDKKRVLEQILYFSHIFLKCTNLLRKFPEA